MKMELKLFYHRIIEYKPKKEPNYFCNIDLFINYAQILFKYFWIFMPVIHYIIIFSMYGDIQNYFGFTCKQNFIVDLDTILFGKNVYPLMSFIQHWSLDLLSAVPYLIHFCLPFVYSIYLLFGKNETKTFLKFCFAFGLVNFFGVLFQSLLPTPPPWMLNTNSEKPIPEANFARVDSMFSVKLFKNLYAQSPLVCGAFPSLHTAWPATILFIKPWISLNFSRFHVLLIMFAAIYSGHHYTIDVIFGLIFAWFSSRLSIFLINKKFCIIDECENKEIFAEYNEL